MLAFPDFKKQFEAEYGDLYNIVLQQNPELLAKKRNSVALKRLRVIIDSTLQLSNRVGFHSMTLRDLAGKADLSIGAIYSYIENKEKLLKVILHSIRRFVELTIQDKAGQISDPVERLEWILTTHIYLSELAQPWFFFTFTESKSFDKASRELAFESELVTENQIRDCIHLGQKQGKFNDINAAMAASLIKPMLQDWYLKRRKYHSREISPEAYVRHVVQFVQSALAVR